MPGRVTVTIDGREVEAEAGELVIKVAQEHGVYIPRFCWHERMKPVGMCRMCLVEIEGQRGLPPACTATVADGMIVRTQTPGVKKAQEGVLEFLLINHPLDCPVCDRGGECPLQDLTFGFGPGDSRFVEEKRHFAKPIPISDLVLLDRERCILCARCTRFAEEIAGDPLIQFVDRGGDMQVLTFPSQPFTSYFSGNTVQICPVGALLGAPYRFKARPWDLSSVETSCTGCSVGCRMALQSTTNRLVRALGVDSEPINHGWLCDRGRFGIDWVHHPDRFAEPVVRDAAGAWAETSWPDALDVTAAGLRRALDAGGPEAVAVIGGARGTNEDAYAWVRLAKGVLRTDNVDCQLGDGLPAEVVNGMPRALIADADGARAIVLLAPDLKEELPVAYLRIRRAVVDLGVPLIDLAPVDHGLSRYATVRLRPRPGEAHLLAARLAGAVSGGAAGADPDLEAAAALLRPKAAEPEEPEPKPVVVVLGRPSLAEPADATVAAASALLAVPGVRFLSALRRGNVHGGLDLGMAPGFLPGRTTLDAGRSWFEAAWGGVPAAKGADTAGILEAAAGGRIEALVLLGADPLSDFPDRDLARRALERVPFLVAVDAYPTASSEQAQIVLPVAIFGEKRGTHTNLEGRLLRLARKVTPPGTAMDDWRVAVELAIRFGADFDFETADEVTDEIAALAPAHSGADAARLRRAAEGIVVPVGDREEPRPGAGHAVTPAADPEPAPIGGPTESLVEAPAPATAAGGVDVAPDLVDLAARPAPAVPDQPRPPLHRWDGAAPAPAPSAPADSTGNGSGNGGSGLRVVAGRRLYDGGVMVSHSAAVGPLAQAGSVAISPDTAGRLGLEGGARVTVTSARGAAELVLVVDQGVPAGAARVQFNPPGPGAHDVIVPGQVAVVSVEKVVEGAARG